MNMKYLASCATTCPIQFQLSIFAIIFFSWFVYQQYTLSFQTMEENMQLITHENRNHIKEDDHHHRWDEDTRQLYTSYLQAKGYNVEDNDENNDFHSHLTNMQSLHPQETIRELLTLH